MFTFRLQTGLFSRYEIQCKIHYFQACQLNTQLSLGLLTLQLFIYVQNTPQKASESGIKNN